MNPAPKKRKNKNLRLLQNIEFQLKPCSRKKAGRENGQERRRLNTSNFWKAIVP
jgi:hypothetical protein